MFGIVMTSWLQTALRRLPAPLIAALDAWSARVARRRLERRRIAAAQRQ